MKNNFKIIDDVVEIELTNRNKDIFIVKISLDDFDKVNEVKGKWQCHYTSSGIYAKAMHEKSTSKDKKVFMHRLITGNGTGVVDHINRNTLDNRRCNLRVVTQQENCFNRKKHKNNSSGVSNVRLNGNKWQGYIRVNNKFISLGLFFDKYDAKRAVDEYKRNMAL